MQITFWGATGTTTGSLHLLDIEGEKTVLDCGLYQGRRALARQLNSEWPCPPSQIRQVVLSHAHIDHCGNLPTLVHDGFDGPIYCTAATGDLVRNLLLDSAHIQEKDAEFASKIRKRKHEPPVEPLYTVEDAEAVLPHLMTMGYYRTVSLSRHIDLRFLEAGHILGSAISQLDISEGERKFRLVFSGDIGRGANAILRDPEIPSDADYLIMESTYGNRNTDAVAELHGRLKEIVGRVAARGGKIIIPAFSVGRTQEIVYQLNSLFNAGELPEIPCFVDSPLSTNVTRVFRVHPDCYNRPVREVMLSDPNPFGFERLRYTENVDESKALNEFEGPCVIISASGMCEAGRILHHLRNNIQDPKNCVLIVGFQAEHTLGRRIVEKRDKVRIFGEEHALRCEVQVLNGFSAHADGDELRDFAFRVKERGNRLKKVFLVHGEPDQQEPLAEYLRDILKIDVVIPERGQTVEIK
ncbi:MAG: metallo-beta-lactamase family protein [Candidatus Sumerlaeota bacterium]|nr:metallo-beta-lactamase family protein [Candidatus Sumerlaeota bacterium]